MGWLARMDRRNQAEVERELSNPEDTRPDSSSKQHPNKGGRGCLVAVVIVLVWAGAIGGIMGLTMGCFDSTPDCAVPGPNKAWAVVIGLGALVLTAAALVFTSRRRRPRNG